MTFDYAKIITTIIWLLVIINLFITLPYNLALALYGIGLFLAITHAMECIAYRKQIHGKPESKPVAYLMTFFFGVLYLRNWPTDPWNGRQ